MTNNKLISIPDFDLYIIEKYSRTNTINQLWKQKINE